MGIYLELCKAAAVQNREISESFFPLFKKVEVQVTCSLYLLQRGHFVIVSAFYLYTCSSSDRISNLINE